MNDLGGTNADEALEQLHPSYVHVVRIEAVLVMVPFLIGSLVIEGADVLPTGLAFAPLLLIAVIVIALFPLRRYRARGFAMSDDRLRVVRGVLFHADVVVPFSRVQHIDVTQGPIERLFGLATLTLHTAGTHNHSVALPGLAHEQATAMREEIRQHVKRESM